MGVFDRQIATAKRLIERNGQQVTWQQRADGAPADSDKPWKPAEVTVTEYTPRIVFLPTTSPTSALLQQLTGTSVPAGKLTGLMAAVDFTPTLKDTVVRGDVTLGITLLEPIAPNGDIIMYTIGFDA